MTSRTFKQRNIVTVVAGALLVGALVAGGLIGQTNAHADAKAQAAPPAVPVSVAVVERRSVTPYE